MPAPFFRGYAKGIEKHRLLSVGRCFENSFILYFCRSLQIAAVTGIDLAAVSIEENYLNVRQHQAVL